MPSRKISIICGVCGFLKTLFGIGMTICCIVLDSKINSVIIPYWGSIPVLITGLIGISIPFSRNECLLTFYLIVNIFLSLIIMICVSLTWMALATYQYVLISKEMCVTMGKDCRCERNGNEKVLRDIQCHEIQPIAMLLEIITIFAFLACFACMVSCGSSCIGLCCGKAARSQVGVEVIEKREPVRNTLNIETAEEYSLDNSFNLDGIIRYKPTIGMRPPIVPPQPAENFSSITPYYIQH